MHAVQILNYRNPFHYGEYPRPEPRANEVLVEVKASGLCSTDLHLLEGRVDLGQLPRIPGHETAGEILELGPDVSGWEVGERVTVAIDVTCKSCVHCLTGQTQRCPNKVRIGFERNGGHAQFVAVPADNLVSLPDNLSYTEASILPDAVACMYHCLIAQGEVGINQKVVVLGVGGLGIHGVQIARLAGAEVLATSRRAHRLQIAREYGALPVDPTRQDLRRAVRDFTQGAGADVVADCIGTQASLRQGLDLLRPGGKLLVIAYIDEEFIVPSIPLFATEMEIIGCRGSTRQELIEVVDLVARGRLRSVIGAEYPLSKIDQAVACLNAGEMVGRIVLTR